MQIDLRYHEREQGQERSYDTGIYVVVMSVIIIETVKKLLPAVA